MNNRSFVAGALVAAALCLGGVQVFSQEKGAADPKDAPKKDAAANPHEGMPDEAAMMAEWAKLMKPGKPHEALEPTVGEWKTTHKMMVGPGMPPMEYKGKSTRQWVLDKRHVHEELSADMPMPGPDGKMGVFPYKGMGYFGYDNARNMYVGNWVHSAGTDMVVMSGAIDHATGKIITCYGHMDEPGLKVYGRWVRYVTKIISKDKFTFEVFDLHAAEDYRVLEIIYERVK